MSCDNKNKCKSASKSNEGFYINKEPSSMCSKGEKSDCGKYKCHRSVKHIRLNIVDSHVGQNSPEWTASTCDPLGSYTGIAENRFEKPVQDADDL